MKGEEHVSPEVSSTPLLRLLICMLCFLLEDFLLILSQQILRVGEQTDSSYKAIIGIACKWLFGSNLLKLAGPFFLKRPLSG